MTASSDGTAQTQSAPEFGTTPSPEPHDNQQNQIDPSPPPGPISRCRNKWFWGAANLRAHNTNTKDPGTRCLLLRIQTCCQGIRLRPLYCCEQEQPGPSVLHSKPSRNTAGDRAVRTTRYSCVDERQRERAREGVRDRESPRERGKKRARVLTSYSTYVLLSPRPPCQQKKKSSAGGATKNAHTEGLGSPVVKLLSTAAANSFSPAHPATDNRPPKIKQPSDQ